MNELQEKINNNFQLREYIHSDYDYNNLIFTIRAVFPSEDNTIDFKKVKEIVTFLKQTIYCEIIIENSIQVFKEDIYFLNFDNCTFLDKVYFENCTFKYDVSLNNCIFESELCFYNTKFLDNTRFHNSIFKTAVSFENSTFHKLIDFHRAVFEKNQQFIHTDFLNIAIFSNTIFNEQIQFLHNKVNSSTSISFIDTKFKKGLDISRANFKCQLHFWNSKLNEDYNEFWLYSSDDIHTNTGNLNIALKRYRETVRIIKNEFKTSGNKIDSLKFLKKEMEIYHKELTTSDNSKWFDKWILYFSKISNEYGTNWSKGVFFTLISGIIFFSIFLLFISDELIYDCTIKSIGLMLKHFFEFINVTNWNFKPFNIDYGYAYIVLFIGRILISYGVIQTIQAFRKYGNN